MRKNQNGFTLIEVLVAIAILGIIMLMNTQLMQDLIRGSVRQNAIVMTQFETALGLELMRTDIENAGFGLADDISGISYTEVDATSTPAFQYNDATTAVPRALVHSNDGYTGSSAGQGYIHNSDYLAIKSPAVGENATAKKWTYITTAAIHEWDTVNTDNDLDMEANDRMIVINPRTAPRESSKLIINTSWAIPFSVPYTRVYGSLDGAFHPLSVGERYMAYGVNRSGAASLRMPFNRADYYVRRRATSNDNPNCAPGTGTLVKATVDHADGALTEMPLVTCVANIQVIFRLDTNGDGIADSTVGTTPAFPVLTAMQIKEQVKEVRVYILAHEGPRDNGYQLPAANRTVTLGDTAALGKSVDLLSDVVGDATWANYRWKVYTLFVKPRSFY
jgi:prepilin-type N-terminal cleavage/methylation domain-containing protein